MCSIITTELGTRLTEDSETENRVGADREGETRGPRGSRLPENLVLVVRSPPRAHPGFPVSLCTNPSAPRAGSPVTLYSRVAPHGSGRPLARGVAHSIPLPGVWLRPSPCLGRGSGCPLTCSAARAAPFPGASPRTGPGSCTQLSGPSSKG